MRHVITIVSALFLALLMSGCTATASVDPHHSAIQNAPAAAQNADADNGVDHTASLDEEDSGNS